MANQIRVGAPLKSTGGLLAGPVNTPLPTDASTALDEALVALGLLGEDGLQETENRSTDEVRVWGGGLGRVLQTEWGIQLTFTFMETSTAVLKEVRGEDNVSEKPSTTSGKTLRTTMRNSKVLPPRVYVAEIKDGNNHIRKVYPQAQITEVGDVTYSHNDTIKYEVTLSCYEDENGNAEYEYEEYKTAA